jgi:predicted AAA+ superfamily ATPase
MWNTFGFSKNLYDTHPVKGDPQGERLLVGREKELLQIKNRISNINSVVTVEGPNGVGKTSLILVAGYQLERETLNRGKRSFILQPNPMQFTAEESASEFKRKVYAQIASHFIQNE